MIDLHAIDPAPVSVPISRAPFPVPFETGLEYAAPARGPWNIVHVGMLVPESHQIFVCAQGCLRGVVLTAAELQASHRFSTISVEDCNMLDGDMEQLILDGVDEIFAGLNKLPRALLLYTSCVHHFMGTDLDYVYRRLREKYPQVDFTDCYMNPIMRKTKTPPDSKMRQQLYSLLKPAPMDKGISLVGSLFPMDPENDLSALIQKSGRPFRAITDYDRYDDFQQMAASEICISINPAAKLAGDTLEKCLGQRHLHLPLSYDYDEIDQQMNMLAETLGVPAPDPAAARQKADAALEKAAAALNGMPVVIDYTATTRPLGLARLLAEHGFQVQAVYADSFLPAEKPAFDWLKIHCPDLMLHPTVHPVMGMLPHESGDELLAIGQKAAWFTGTHHFVNLLEGGGHYGYDGICQLAGEIEAGAAQYQDVPAIIQVKGWGCCG